jgi:hypothetical protein
MIARPLPRIALAAALAASAAAWAQDNPLTRNPPPAQQLIGGQWAGVDLERRSNCTHPENNGVHQTWAAFTVGIDGAGNFTIDQLGVTGLNCSWRGQWTSTANGLSIQGTYSCTDGKQGTFATRKVDVNGTAFTMQLSIQLANTETCSVDGVLSMARFYP